MKRLGFLLNMTDSRHQLPPPGELYRAATTIIYMSGNLAVSMIVGEGEQIHRSYHEVMSLATTPQSVGSGF